MKINNSYKIITDTGNTTDIIDVVMMAYELENDFQIKSLADKLRGNSELETCRNIYNYLIRNIKYVADIGTQEIKSPARLVVDKVGDCKSYSIFTASILKYLGVKHFFRFVSYSRFKEATHVYVVALINKQEIPIDAVAAIQANIKLGDQLKYTFKVDMNNRTTRIAYLSGIKNIGSTDADVRKFLNSDAFKFWLDGENEDNITFAKSFLLSEWDKYWSLFAVSRTAHEMIVNLNYLELISSMIRFYNEFSGDAEMLTRAGYAFARFINYGTFSKNVSEPKEREFFSDKIHNAVLNFSETSNFRDDSFMQFWQKNIVDNDYIISGIGSTDIVKLREDIKKTGGYYLYTYLSRDEAEKLGAIIYRKKLVQDRIFSLSKEVLTTSKKMSDAEFDNIVFSGCLTTWGATPENTIKELTNTKNRVGLEPTTIILICKVIVAIITVIVAIVSAIKALKDITPETVEAGTPATTDWTNTNGGGNGTVTPNNNTLKKSGLSLLLPLSLVATWVYKNKNKFTKK